MIACRTFGGDAAYRWAIGLRAVGERLSFLIKISHPTHTLFTFGFYNLLRRWSCPNGNVPIKRHDASPWRSS